MKIIIATAIGGVILFAVYWFLKWTDLRARGFKSFKEEKEIARRMDNARKSMTTSKGAETAFDTVQSPFRTYSTIYEKSEYERLFSVADTAKGPKVDDGPMRAPDDSIQCTNSEGGLYWRDQAGFTYYRPPANWDGELGGGRLQ